MRALSHVFCVALLVSLSACITPPEPAPDVAVTPEPEQVVEPAAEPPRVAIVQPKAVDKPTAVPRHKLKPMPVRPLDVQTDCRFRNETGYNGEATLEVRRGQVRRFRAIVNPPQGGTCLFELAGMRQTKTVPNIELKASKSACTVRMWEQGKQVTVSFSNCSAQCGPRDAFKYVWPILVDRPSGKCA